MNHPTEMTYLVLTRKFAQRIFIGENVIIKVLNTQCNHVVLGIHAPKEITILREEVRQRQQQCLKALL